jgi:hypothetical protein
MATRTEITQRRTEFYLVMAHGARLNEAVKIISEKYGVTSHQLYLDWNNRLSWGIDLVEPLDPETTINDALFRLTELRRRLWMIIDDQGAYKDNHAGVKDKLKSIIALIDLEFRLLEMAQSVGAINKAPIRIDIEERSAQVHDRIAELCGDDERMMDAVTQVMYELAQQSDN